MSLTSGAEPGKGWVTELFKPFYVFLGLCLMACVGTSIMCILRTTHLRNSEGEEDEPRLGTDTKPYRKRLLEKEKEEREQRAREKGTIRTGTSREEMEPVNDLKEEEEQRTLEQGREGTVSLREEKGPVTEESIEGEKQRAREKGTSG